MTRPSITQSQPGMTDIEVVRKVLANSGCDELSSRASDMADFALLRIEEELKMLLSAMRSYWFAEILPDLDFETGQGDPGWHSHPWYELLNLTDDECYDALSNG